MENKQCYSITIKYVGALVLAEMCSLPHKPLPVIKHKSSLWGACAHGQTLKTGAVTKSIPGFTPSSAPNANLQVFMSVLGLILGLAVRQRNIIPFSCAPARG